MNIFIARSLVEYIYIIKSFKIMSYFKLYQIYIFVELRNHLYIFLIIKIEDFYIFIETNNKTKNHIIFVVLINKIVNLTQ
jgi:hypothetical protein